MRILINAGISSASIADIVGFMSPMTNLRTELSSVLEFNAAGDVFESRGQNPTLIQETLFRFQSYHV